MTKISTHAVISKFADIETSKRGTKVIIEDYVNIDSFVKIKTAGGNGDVIIGQKTFINSGVVIYSGNGVRIGNNVLIAANCVLAPVNHEFFKKNILIAQQGFQPSRGGIIIEDDVWIGAGTVLLDGTIIKKGAIIGANSLVNSLIDSYTICVGSPCKKIGERK